MPNDSNIIEEHLRIVIDPSTYSEINRISESVREMREDFSEMPHLGEMLNSSLERTSTLTDTVNRKLQKASDITFDTQDDRDRFSANAHASVEDLRVMHKLQTTNDDFNPAVVRNWAKGLSSALSKELDAIIPDLASIFRSRMSPLTTAGNSAYKNTFQEVSGLSQAMFHDKSVQQLLKTRVTQSYSDDVIKQLLRVVVANNSPMMRLDDYTNLRYNSNVRENAKAAELNSPLSLLPASFQASFKNKGYLSRGEDLNEQRKWLTASAYKVIQKLLAENPVAVNAAVRSGIARRDDRGVLELQRNISRKDYDDLRRSIYGEFTARATGAGEYRVADIYTDDAAAAKVIAGRMAGSSSAGSVIRAMHQLEALEAADAWVERQRQGSAYIKQSKEPKRALDQYSILSFAPFDSTKRPQKEVSITESNNTRLLGLQNRGYNGDASDTIATISLSGYDKNNEAHVAELRKLFEEGKEVQSIGGKTVRMRVQSMHRGDDGAILRLVEESAMAAVDEQLRPIAEAAGLRGSYWTNYQNTDKFDDLVHYRKHLDARNKGWTPSAELGVNLDGKKIAVVDMSTVDGDRKTELADGTGWLSEGILPTPIQFRGGVSGKGTLRPLPGETNYDFAIRSGLATQDQNGQRHWYVQGANPNDAPIDIIDYNGFVDKSVIKNMSAYRNADGTLKSSEEINETFMEMLRISPLSVVKDFSKMDSESDRIGVQMMSFMDISPELQMRQQQQLSKRLQELDTEEGMLKYVFPASNEDYLSTQVNDPEKRWLLQGTEAQKRVALYREELMRKAMSGEWIEFGDDPNDTISNVELAGSPLAAFFRMNGVNEDVRKIAKEALAKELGKEYSDQEIDDILKLRGTKRNADGTIEYGYGIDFGRADQEELGFLRSPTGYGNMVVARNVAKEVQAIYAALAGNIPEGMDSSMFSKDFLEAGGVILAPEDLKTLSGADLDADTVKTVTGNLKDAVKSTIEHTVMMPEKDTQLQITKRKQDGVVSDSVENRIDAVGDLTYEPLGMGLYSAAIRGMQFDPTNPEYIDRIRGFHKGQVGYDATTTIFKDPKDIARDKDIDKAVAAGKEYTRFTQNVKDIFSLDEDMYDDKGNILDAHQDMYRASNGTVINMRKLKELDLLHTNLPSVYMDNHVLGLASMGRQYREGRVDTTRFDAMAEALSHMGEYDQELYSSAGAQTKALMESVNQLYPQFGTGKRTKLTDDETKQLRELYDGALGEIVQQAMQQEVVPGRVLNKEGKQVNTNWLVHHLKKKYGLTRVENTLKEFGFTDDRLESGLPESLRGFFVNSADAKLNIPEVSQVNSAANAPQIVEQLNKAKEESAAEINKLEQEKAELDKKLADVGKNGVMQMPMTQEEHDQIETRKQEIDKQVAAKQNEYQNTDAMQRQAIEWYKDQVEFESVFASAREFNSGLWKSRLSKEAHIEDKSQADLYYNKQHGIANYHATMLDDLIKRTGLSGEQKESLIKLRSDILSGVDVDFADKTVSNAKHLAESLNARVDATTIDYDKTEHEIDGYIKKLKEAEEYQKKLIDMDSEGKFAEEIKQTGEYISTGYKTAEQLRHNLYTQDIAGEDKMIDRLQRFTRDRNRRYSQSQFERQMLVNENDFEQYEQQYEAISQRLSIWQARKRGLTANGQVDTENYKLATQEIERLSSALAECQKEMDGLTGASGRNKAAMAAIGETANRAIHQFASNVFHKAINEAQNFVVTYDDAMTEIQMVTLKTDSEIDTLGDGLIEKAVDLKAAVGDVTSAATSLYRQGLGDEAVDERLDDVIKFSTTAKVKTDDAIKLITVAMNSGMVDNSEQAMDVISALGDSAATEASEITKGLLKTTSAAKEVGVTYEQLISMLAVITSKTQLSGSVAGTTMRNVLSRLARVTPGDMIYDENGHAISGTDLARVLRSIGIDTYDANGRFRGGYDVLSDIGKVWDDLEDAQKQSVSYVLGGTEQFSNVAALVQGFSEVDENGVSWMDKYLEIAEQSDNATSEKYEHYMNSLAGAMTNVKNSWDALVNSATDSDPVIDVLNFFSDSVSGIAKFNDELEGMPSTIALVTAAIIGLTAAMKLNPAIGGAALAIGGLTAFGQYWKRTSDSDAPDEYQQYTERKTQRDDLLSKAQDINNRRNTSGELSASDKEDFANTITELIKLGYITLDAGESLKILTDDFDAASKAISEARTNIENTNKQEAEQFAQRNIETINAGYQAGSFYSERYVEMNEGKQTVLQNYFNNGTNRVFASDAERQALVSAYNQLNNAGKLDDLVVPYKKSLFSPRQDYSWVALSPSEQVDVFNQNNEALMNRIREYAFSDSTHQAQESSAATLSIASGYRDQIAQTLEYAVPGITESGLLDAGVNAAIQELDTAYYAAPDKTAFNARDYLVTQFEPDESQTSLDKFVSWLEKYDVSATTTYANQRTPMYQVGYVARNARLNNEIDTYGTAYAQLSSAYFDSQGATTQQQVESFVNQIGDPENGIKNLNAVIESNDELAAVLSSILTYDEKHDEYRVSENVGEAEWATLGRILAEQDARTHLDSYRGASDIASSALSTFETLRALDDIDSRRQQWENLSVDDATNKQLQSDLESVLGEDLLYRFVNGLLDENGMVYAQSRIDAYEAESRIAPGDYQDEVQSIIKGLTGAYSEQMSQFASLQSEQTGYERALYSYNRVTSGMGTSEDYTQIGSALGLDADVVQNMARTEEGRKQLEADLNKRIDIYSDTLSQALLALLPEEAIDDLQANMDIDDILAVFKENVSEDVYAIIETVLKSIGVTYDGKSFDANVDVDSGKISAWQGAVDYRTEYQATHRDDEMLTYLKNAVMSGDSVKSYAEQHESQENWDEFYNNNPMIASAVASYDAGEGIIDRDQLLTLINESLFGGEKSSDFYDVGASAILGDDYEDGNLDWQSVLDTYASLKGTDIGDVLIGSMEETEEGVEVINLLNEALRDGEISAEEAEKALKQYVDAMGSRNISQLTKYNKANQKIVDTFEALTSGGSEAAEAYNDLFETTRKLSNAGWALEQYQTGDRSDKVTSILSEQFGIDETKLKKASSAQAKLFTETMSDSYDDQLAQLKSNFDANFGNINNFLGDAFAQLPEDFQIPTIGVGGKVDVSGLLKAFSESGIIVDSAWTSMITAMAEAGATFTVGADGNSLMLDVSNLKTGGGGYYGGGGSGGSKKSSADKLTERLNHGQNLYEHQIKMVQYEQTRYQNADELGNYGKMIEEEIAIEKAYLPVLEANISALKSELATVDSGSEDWYKLRDAILEAEEQYADINNTIDENEKKLEENQQAILKLHTDLEEMVVGEIELRIEAEKEMLDGSVSMQDTILNAIKQRYQDEWDLIKQDIEKKKEALQQEKDLIDERLDARREAEDEAAKYEELTELKKQLSLISMDSTRTKDAAALRESIAELEKEIGWDIAEKEAENEKSAIQDQIDAYDDYVTSGDEDLEDLLSDANNFAEEVNGVMKLSQSELFEWLKQNVKDYANSLDDAQKQMVQSWEATYKQMLGITDTYWDEVNAILSAKDTFLEYMKQSKEYIYASDDERAQLLYQWGDAYDKWRLAQKNEADYSHGDAGLGDWSGSEYTGSSSSSGSSGSSSGSKTDTTDDTQSDVEANAKKYYVYDSAGKSSGPYSSLSIAESLAKQAADRGNGAYVKDGNGNIIVRYTATGDVIDAVSGADSNQGNTATHNSRLPRTGWPDYLNATSKHGYYYKITKDGINVSVSGTAYPTRDKAAEEAKKVLKSGQKYQTKYFKYGGIADFTGPAWLDGTKQRPERILNADQTDDFETLVKIMDDFRNSGVSMDVLRSMARWSTSINIPSSLSHIGNAAYQGNSANIGDIFVNITEAQISDDRDIEELANIVGQKFVKEIGKQGFNVSRYNF